MSSALACKDLAKHSVYDMYRSMKCNMTINSKLSIAFDSDIASKIESLDQLDGLEVKRANDLMMLSNMHEDMGSINSLKPSGLTQ